jgi:hypothetical protein
MASFEELLESVLLDPTKISLTRPSPQHRTSSRLVSAKEKPNLVANRYKIQPNESPAIKALQSGTHKRIPISKAEVNRISKIYNLRLIPGKEKCINSNSRIFIRTKPNGSGEVYVR